MTARRATKKATAPKASAPLLKADDELEAVDTDGALDGDVKVEVAEPAEDTPPIATEPEADSGLAVAEPAASADKFSLADGVLAGRIQAILADERSEGRERFCVKLACEAPALDAERVLEMASDINPVASTRPIRDRAEAAGTGAVANVPTQANNTDPWAKVVKPLNDLAARNQN